MKTTPHAAAPRVLLLTDTITWAGTERHILDLARGLCDEKVDVRIACPKKGELASRAAAHGVRVHAIENRNLPDGAAVRTLRHLLRSGSVNIIHAHNGRTGLLASLATQLAGHGRCVVTQHFLKPAHLDEQGLRAKLSRQAHGWVNTRIDHFIAISQAVRNEMLARGDAPEDKITVVPNGLVRPDRQTLAPPSCVRAELDIKKDAPLVVCVARLESEKDIGSLIVAMGHVLKVHPGARCVIAGDGTEKAALSEQIRQLGIAPQVRLPGFVADTMSLINAADLFVLPSPAEPFGLVLLEAMALGKPVVATRAGGPLEIVVNGQTGLLVPPADASGLAHAILHLLTAAGQRCAMGERGQARLDEFYTARHMAHATLAVYRQVVASHS
ncbi:MAG TPA: glycosyltransferase family 4 protein [Abditibacteriaceae bacterium]|nr:glycosyltransferase family 4 protein [Abditibacteriaceae bacterium]